MKTLAVIGLVSAMAVAVSLSLLVLRAGRGRAANRRLACVFLFESLFLAGLAALAFEGGIRVPRWMDTWQLGTFVFVAVSYLWFLATLETPITHWLRPTAMRLLVALYGASVTLGIAAIGGPAAQEDTPADIIVGLGATGFATSVAAFGLVCAVSAFRRAAPGSSIRERAKWYLAAFGARDALYVTYFVAGISINAAAGPGSADLWWSTFPALVVLVYAPIMTYGLVRHQILDIDLKLKMGIRRSTVATIMLVVVLAAAKVAEFYLNRTYGFVAGGVAAGMMLVLAPRLNKLGDKIATKTLPGVENTSAYLQFRKMEVYRAALESAHETGGITEKERAALELLRQKMGISARDGLALEEETAERFGATQPPQGPNLRPA